MDPAKEPATDWKAFEPYTAKRMTEKLCRFFDERLEVAEEGVRGKGLRIEDRGLRDLGGRSEDRGLRGRRRKFQGYIVTGKQIGRAHV